MKKTKEERKKESKKAAKMEKSYAPKKKQQKTKKEKKKNEKYVPPKKQKKQKLLEMEDEKIEKEEQFYLGTKSNGGDENPIDLTKDEDPLKGIPTKGRFFHDKSEEINELAKKPLLVHSNKKEFHAVCYKCGEINHFHYNCPNSICDHCQNPGHKAKVF
jgi:hypothetical protein